MTPPHASTETAGATGAAGPAPPAAAPGRSPWTAVLAGWRRHSDVLDGASALAATTGVTSALGFAYWAVAARLFSRQAVGYGSATISAMTLLAMIGMLGLGTVLIGELPRRSPRGGLVSAALLSSALGSLVLGLLFAGTAPLISEHFANMTRVPVQAALMVAGVILTAVSLVFDQATIGLMRGGLQLTRNLVFVVAKLAALPGVVLIMHDQLGTGITLSWVAGTAVSMGLVAAQLRLRGTRVLPRPDWRVLRSLGTTAVAHSWLNLAIFVPRSVMPVLVTVVVSPLANAAFFLAWTLTGFLYIVPVHLATVLFAVASADPQKIARKLRFTLRLSVLAGLPAMAALGLGAHLVLSLFGASYARAGTMTLVLLLIGYLPSIPKVHYIAVCRATGRITRAATVLTLAAAVEVAAAAAGGAAGGVRGLTLALLAVYFAEGLVTAPPVARAAIGYGRHRRPAPPPGAGGKRKAAGRQAQQGMEVLVSLARSAGVDPRQAAAPGPPGPPGH